MKCQKCGSEVVMNAGVVVTCFFCGATIRFREAEPVPDSMKKEASTLNREDHPKWFRKKMAVKRRRDRILQALLRGEPRSAIAKVNRCSRSLVNTIARENGVQAYGKAIPGQSYIGRVSIRRR